MNILIVPEKCLVSLNWYIKYTSDWIIKHFEMEEYSLYVCIKCTNNILYKKWKFIIGCILTGIYIYIYIYVCVYKDYVQVNSLRLKSNVASNWARKHLWGYHLFCCWWYIDYYRYRVFLTGQTCGKTDVNFYNQPMLPCLLFHYHFTVLFKFFARCLPNPRLTQN